VLFAEHDSGSLEGNYPASARKAHNYPPRGSSDGSLHAWFGMIGETMSER
jgi:hypothetical protein